MTKIRILAACFIGLNILDALLTKIAIGSGQGAELNPIMKLLLERPAYEFMIIKIGLAMVFAAAIVIAAQKFPGQTRRILTALVACMTGICLFNGIPLVLI